MAMCATTNRQIMLTIKRARAENQRRVILGIFAPRQVLSIDEITFQTKLQRHDVISRLGGSPWFSPEKGWGQRRGFYRLSAAGVHARRQGLHLQQVVPKPPREITPKLAAIQEQREPNPNWHQPDSFCEYIPNEEQIAAAIAEVQATWDDEERWKRRTSLAEPLGSLE